MQIFENLPPIVGLILGFVLLVWLVFVFLVPFMIEAIRRSARETREELVELNRKLDELTTDLTESARAADSAPRPTAPPPPQKPATKAEAGRTEARRRREPTISETDFQNEPRPSEPRPSRREPRVK
jgi:hypothetical protein